MGIERGNFEKGVEDNGFGELETIGKTTNWKKHLDDAKKLLSEKLSTKGEKEKSSQYYLLSEQLKNPGIDKEGKKYFKNIYESWDNCGIDIPLELGKMVEGVINDPNCVFGIHHSNSIDGKDYQQDYVLHSILKDGLINMGDMTSGRVYKDPPISKTVSICNNMLNATIGLKGSYKGSTGAVLVKIPSEYVNKDGDIKPGMEGKVYNYDEIGNSVLKPEFILGFAQNLGKGTIEYKTRKELLEGYKPS